MVAFMGGSGFNPPIDSVSAIKAYKLHKVCKINGTSPNTNHFLVMSMDVLHSQVPVGSLVDPSPFIQKVVVSNPIHYGDLYSAPSRLQLRSAPDPCTAKKKSFEARVECVRKNPGEQS